MTYVERKITLTDVRWLSPSHGTARCGLFPNKRILIVLKDDAKPQMRKRK